MVASVVGKLTLASVEQPSKACAPMVVTFAGNVTLVRAEQPLNALAFTSVTDVKYLNSLNLVISLPANTVPRVLTASASV